MSCTVLLSPLGRSYFWMFYGAKLLPLCPWSLSHTGIALGIPMLWRMEMGIWPLTPTFVWSLLTLGTSSSFKPSTFLQVSWVRAAGSQKGQEMSSRAMELMKRRVWWLRTRVQRCWRTPVRAIQSRVVSDETKAGWHSGETHNRRNGVLQVKTGRFWQS